MLRIRVLSLLLLTGAFGPIYAQTNTPPSNNIARAPFRTAAILGATDDTACQPANLFLP